MNNNSLSSIFKQKGAQCSTMWKVFLDGQYDNNFSKKIDKITSFFQDSKSNIFGVIRSNIKDYDDIVELSSLSPDKWAFFCLENITSVGVFTNDVVKFLEMFRDKNFQEYFWGCLLYHIFKGKEIPVSPRECFKNITQRDMKELVDTVPVMEYEFTKDGLKTDDERSKAMSTVLKLTEVELEAPMDCPHLPSLTRKSHCGQCKKTNETTLEIRKKSAEAAIRMAEKTADAQNAIDLKGLNVLMASSSTSSKDTLKEDEVNFGLGMEGVGELSGAKKARIEQNESDATNNIFKTGN